MSYVLKKGHYGWEARSSIPLGEGYKLELSTGKSARGLVSHATRVKDEGDGAFSFMIFSDYSKLVGLHVGVRATEKAVKAAHEEALAKLDSIKAEVLAFYAAKESA